MQKTAELGVTLIRGPDGVPLTHADLPLPDTKRWVIRRKAIVVAAVRGGLLSLDAACSRYALDAEEFLTWQYYIDRYGFLGLRTTKIQSYGRPDQGEMTLGAVRNSEPTHAKCVRLHDSSRRLKNETSKIAPRRSS